MTVKELVEKLTVPEVFEKYKDCVVEKAVPSGDLPSGSKTYIGEEVAKVLQIDNVGLPDDKPLDIKFRKIMLF